MRSLSVVLVSLIGLVSCAAGPPAIRVCVNNGGCGVGTTVADTPYLLTAGHVLSMVTKGSLVMLKANEGVTDGRGESIENTIIVAGSKIDYPDDGSDAALMHVPVIDDQNYPLCDPIQGEEIIVYTLRGEMTGEIELSRSNFLFMSAQLQRGDSGSAIVSKARKCVVGLAIALLFGVDADGGTGDLEASIGVGSNVLRKLIKGGQDGQNQAGSQ